jgi:hypothetical protein
MQEKIKFSDLDWKLKLPVILAWFYLIITVIIFVLTFIEIIVQ